MVYPIIPQERLRVFVSSAQNNENGFAWCKIRKRIKAQMIKCPYLNPFIIEDVASEIPSNQLFEFHVQRSDIIILLVKGELRRGTATEFAVATKHKKPLLIYFLEDDNPSLGVVQLKKDIQISDQCTYHYLETFDGIEINICNEVIENVIRYYQYKHFYGDNVEDSVVSLLDNEELGPSKLSAPSKSAIDMFSSSYDYILDLLDISYLKQREVTAESSLHHLGVSALNWLVTGKNFDCGDSILGLIEKASDLYSDTKWLIMRWDAIKYEIAGDIERALVKEQEALTLAKASCLPKWIINDILIDCRNIEYEVNHSKRQMVLQSEAQNELSQSDTIVYLPVLDRYLENAYEGIIKEELRIGTASHNTMFFGTNLATVLGNIENYFFSAMIYGSYSHIMLAREALANVLFKYAELTEDSTLFLAVIKLLVLQGDTKGFKQITLHKWDNIYSSIVSSANNLWSLTDGVSVDKKDSMKLAVLSILGMYLSDDVFVEAERYLEDFSPKVYWGNSEEYFECIQQNVKRIKSEKVISMITCIIKEQRFHLGGKLSNIILCLKLEDVNSTLQTDLCGALMEQITFIVRNNGNPQLIAILEKQNPEVFSPLAGIPDNGLVGIQKLLYDINMDKGEWCKIIIDEIDIAKRQFIKNNNTGTYSVFGEQPYAMITQIVRNHYTTEMDVILTKQFFPLCVNVISSQVAIQVKEDCIACLCDVIVLCKRNGVSIPMDLLTVISQIDASYGNSFYFEISSTKETFVCRVLMLKIVAGVMNKEDLLDWCIGYGKKTTKERIALAECIEQFLHYENNPQERVDTLILSIVFQCLEDDQYSVRQRACSCLMHMFDTRYCDLVERKLYEAAVDPSHFVRNFILHLCKGGQVRDEAIRNRLIEILKNDANYAIRNCAQN